MKSLISKASRPVTPVNPIITKPILSSEGRNNPESKVPKIQKSSSLLELKENLSGVWKTLTFEVYKPNLPELLKEDTFLENEKNDYVNTLKLGINKLLYGTPTIFNSEIEKNRHELKENFLRFVHQQNYAELHRDVNPSQRLFNGSDDGFKVKRQDKSPYLKSPESIIPNNSKEELMGVSGSKIYENVIGYFSKSMLDKEGRVIPVNATDLEIYT